MAIFKWLFLKALGSKTLDSIESRAPQSDVPIKSGEAQHDLSERSWVKP